MKNNYLTNHKSSQCYGCGICATECPTNAISMVKDKKGFWFPQVDKNKCIECGKCNTACPIKIEAQKNESTIYQVANKSAEILLRSQCGGVFTTVSDYVLKQNGVVYGAIIDNNDFAVKHVRASDKNTRDLMCGSKYVQSLIERKIYETLESDLNNGKYVLFTGTPCQCAAVRKNYGKYKNLIILDFICHGVPTPELWGRYLKHISEKHNAMITKAMFRNKRCRKVGNHTESYWSDDNTEYLENDYAALFYSHLAHRDTCFECQFANSNRYSDLTMGGFLEPSDFEAEFDSSMLIINTIKGRKVFEEIKTELDWVESKLGFYKNQPCLYHPVSKPQMYDAFWHDWNCLEMRELIEKYATDEIKDKFHIRIMTFDEEY